MEHYRPAAHRALASVSSSLLHEPGPAALLFEQLYGLRRGLPDVRASSGMLRSGENLPEPATLRRDMRVQRTGSCQARSPPLAGAAGIEVGQRQVGVMVERVVDQEAEQLSVAAGENAAADEIEHLPRHGVGRVQVHGPVAPGLDGPRRLGAAAEQDEVLRPPSWRISTFALSRVPMVSAPL